MHYLYHGKLSKLHFEVISPFLRCPGGAQNICAELEQDGFQVSVQEGAIEGEWLCLARLNFIPSTGKLSELQVVFEDLITKIGGKYDGWETIVILK